MFGHPCSSGPLPVMVVNGRWSFLSLAFTGDMVVECRLCDTHLHIAMVVYSCTFAKYVSDLRECIRMEHGCAEG